MTNKFSVCVIHTNGGFYGRGDTAYEATQNAIKAGARKTGKGLLTIFTNVESQSDIEVNGGNVYYNPEKYSPTYVYVNRISSITEGY